MPFTENTLALANMCLVQRWGEYSTNVLEYDWTCRSTGTQKTNVVEYDYFTIYMITLECNHDYFHDYFNEYPVSNIKATFMESLGVILVLLLCH